MTENDPATVPDLDALGSGEFLDRWIAVLQDLDHELDVDEYGFRSAARLDVFFLAFLRTMARFGIFSVGPITIHLPTVEQAVRLSMERARSLPPTDDLVALLDLVYAERARSGRKSVDEVHMLLAFMKVGRGVPARVFGELGVTPEQVEDFIRHGPRQDEPPAGGMETLYSPEEAAAYLKVHVQTVREWIRTGRLKASRLAGQRALRIRASDLIDVLEPLEPGDS